MVWLRKFRIWLISTVAIVLIILAVVFSILRAFLPHATAYTADIEQQISTLLGLPVSIESLDADMHWLTPRLKLINFVIYKNESHDVLIAFSEASFSLAIFDSIRYLMPMAGSISLRGADILIEKHPNNQWTLQGLEINSEDSASNTAGLIKVLSNMNLAILGSHVHWRDYTDRSNDMDFDDASIAIESFLGSHSLRMDLALPKNLGSRFRIIAEMNGDIFQPNKLEGTLYISGRALELDSWINHTRLQEYVHADGNADVEFWIDINAGKVTQAAGRFDTRKIQLSCVDGCAESWHADDFSGNVFWRRRGNGWRADIRQLKLARSGDPWTYATNASVIRDRTNAWSVTADYLRLHDISRLADIFVRKDQRQRFDDLLSYQLQGDVFNLSARIAADNPLRTTAVADFSDLGFNVDAKRFSLRGLDGTVHFQPGLVELKLDTKAVELTLGSVFRQPLWLDGLTGVFTVTQRQGRWMLASQQARLWNADIQTVSTLQADVDKDGKVFLDMLSSYRNALAVAARKYLPVAVLPDALIHWLDKALLGGKVSSGGFVFRGDMARFPFRDNDGVMEASFETADTSLHFLDGWPDIHHLNGSVRFFNSSLQIDRARGHEDSGASSNARAEIADLHNPLLKVSADITASAPELQDYVWNSGLKPILGTAVAQFQAQGQARISLELAMPLHHDAGVLRTRGKIRFDDNEVYFPATDYQLTTLNGTLRFDGERIYGSGLSALFDGSPVVLDVDDIQDKAGRETRFRLTGNWRVASLLSKFHWHFPQLMDGRSDWEVSVHLPHKVHSYAVRVDAKSDMKGVSLNLTDAIKKPPQQAHAFRLQLDMLGEAIQFHADVDNLLKLQASRDGEQRWHFVADSAVFSGKGSFMQDFDTDSMITLDLDHIDLSAFKRTQDAQSLDWHLAPEAIPSLQLKTASLSWGDWTFANVTAQTQWHPRGMVLSAFEVDDAAVKIKGKGSWLRRSWQKQTDSDISFTVNSNNIGDLLERLGYPRFVNNSKLSASANWRWPDAPYSFAWGSVEGSSSIELDQGVITDISPGAGGRLLGLLNLLQLPKRLSLDFKDVYRKGFVFDSVKGHYMIAKGEAVTQDTVILASAADINMLGSVGLDDQDYDLITTVRPHATGATFTGGYLAGGVIVGTGLVLLQEVLGLDLLGQDMYSIKGGWENPVIKQIAESAPRNETELDDDF